MEFCAFSAWLESAVPPEGLVKLQSALVPVLGNLDVQEGFCQAAQATVRTARARTATSEVVQARLRMEYGPLSEFAGPHPLGPRPRTVDG